MMKGFAIVIRTQSEWLCICSQLLVKLKVKLGIVNFVVRTDSRANLIGIMIWIRNRNRCLRFRYCYVTWLEISILLGIGRIGSCSESRSIWNWILETDSSEFGMLGFGDWHWFAVGSVMCIGLIRKEGRISVIIGSKSEIILDTDSQLKRTQNWNKCSIVVVWIQSFL